MARCACEEGVGGMRVVGEDAAGEGRTRAGTAASAGAPQACGRGRALTAVLSSRSEARPLAQPCILFV